MRRRELPVSPSVTGSTVWFAEQAYDCDTPNFSVRAARVPGPGSHDVAFDDQLTWQLSVDTTSIYRLTGPAGPDQTEALPCQGDRGPCQITQQPLPAGTSR